MKRDKNEVGFQVFAVFIMVLMILSVILPFMHIISVSLSDKKAVSSFSVGIFPKGLNFKAYGDIIKQGLFLSSMRNTIFVTATVAVISLIVNIMAAYAFSKEFFGKKIITYIFVITMYFSGGLIPSYILMTRWLNLNNNYLAFILPGLVNVFYIIIIRSQIESIPASLSEAAVIDGATEYQVLFYVILPALGATIAAIGMFIALGSWNMWFPVMIYSNKREMWSLQYFLRIVVFDKASEYLPAKYQAVSSKLEHDNPQNFQMAAIVLVALPIVSIYPFIQKYFVKGILTGSVKE